MKSLNSCQRELQSIINELESIENGVRHDFDGIGEAYCANCIGRVVSHYSGVLRRLQNVDTNRLGDWVNKKDEENN